jgi:hypothetical protein
MQAQHQVRIAAAPVTAALVLVATLALGAFGGYVVATALRAPAAVAPVQRVVLQTQSPVVDGSNPSSDDGVVCIPGFTPCIDRGNSEREPLTQQLPASPPMFDEGKMCTFDFKVCREPQNSYD